MRTSTGVLAAILLGLLFSSAASAKDWGLYFGGSIGSGSVEISDINFDEDDFAWKAFGGFTLGSWLGVEGGYVDINSDFTGFNAVGIAGLPLGPVRVFGKLGGIYWDSDIGASDDGFDPALGVGVEFSLFSIALRAEIEYFDALDDVYLATVGATWTF